MDVGEAIYDMTNKIWPIWYDQNNLLESFFPTYITLNKMPKVWNSLNSEFESIFELLHYDLLHLQSHCSVTKLYAHLVNSIIYG